jgi:hypothetical protein
MLVVCLCASSAPSDFATSVARRVVTLASSHDVLVSDALGATRNYAALAARISAQIATSGSVMTATTPPRVSSADNRGAVIALVALVASALIVAIMFATLAA